MPTSEMALRTKRVYEDASPDDGFRLLTMRFWPRGVRKDRVDAWEKELGPSPKLLGKYRNGDVLITTIHIYFMLILYSFILYIIVDFCLIINDLHVIL